MSFQPNLTEQDLNNLGMLGRQPKNQHAIETRNKSFKQTNDKKLAETFSPITMKLKEVDKFTKK